MLRRIRLPFFFCLAAAWTATLSGASVWPEQFAGYTRGSTRPVVATDKPLWDEYGFDQGEQAEYTAGDKSFKATAIRMKDPTGALALYQILSPADATPSKTASLAVETPKELLLSFANYVLRFEGLKPDAAMLTPLLEKLPQLDTSSLPPLLTYMPAAGQIPNTARSILGPVSLARVEPRLPPSVGAFHMGAEAQYSKYKSQGGEMGLLLFSYPTPHIARDRLVEYQKLAGALVKRSGPLIAVVFSPPDPDDAERLLALVRYSATITLSERVPNRRDNVGDLILNIFTLTGILLLFCTVAGLAVAGFRIAARRWLGGKHPEDPIILLHLVDR